MKTTSKFLTFITLLVAMTMLTTAALPFAGTAGTASPAGPSALDAPSPLAASTFFGAGEELPGTVEGAVAVTGTATAADGTIYAVGYVTAGTLPTSFTAYDTTRGGIDGFVARFSPDLAALLACTYLGGSSEDRCTAVAVASDGSVYVTGYTLSGGGLPQTPFPTTTGAYDTTYGGNAKRDAFVSKLSPNLNLLTASTFLGGGDTDQAAAVAVAGDSVIVAGSTYSADFPTTAGAYDTTYNGGSDGFVAVLSSDLRSLRSSTLIGGSGDDTISAMTVFDDKVFFTGAVTSGDYPTSFTAYDTTRGGVDAFVSSMPLSLASLSASTYLGGSSAEYGLGIAVDSTGVYVVGSTASSATTGTGRFPTTSGAYDTSYNGGTDAFVSKLSPNLGSLLASTFLGGSGYDRALGLTVSQGSVFVVGESMSANFPVTADAYDASANGQSDATVTQFDAGLALVTSTYLGGVGNDAASSVIRASNGGIIVAGSARSENFPTTGGAYDTSFNGGTGGADGFLARLDIGGAATHEPVVAAFSASPLSGGAPLSVHFTDLSTGFPTSWAWDFGDGTTSTAQSPSHVYNNPGVYTVTLTASNSAGGDTVTRTDLISAEWSLFHGNQQLTGYYGGDMPDPTAMTQIWKSVDVRAGGSYGDGSLTVGGGMVFVYCFTTTSYITALDVNTGQVVWSKKCTVEGSNLGSWATPVYADGLVFTPRDVARYANNGTPAWPEGRYLAAGVNGGPTVVDGKVIQAEYGTGRYYCYDEFTGEQLWVFNTNGGQAQGVAAYHAGKVFLTSYAAMYCVNATTGQSIWGVAAGVSPYNKVLNFCGSPAIDNGFVYVTTYNFDGDGTLACYYESNGTQMWKVSVARTDSTPAIWNGMVFISGGAAGYSATGTTAYYANNGTLVWSYPAGGWMISCVVADGHMYMAGLVLNATTGAYVTGLSGIGGTVAISGGRVYGMGSGGFVYCYGLVSTPPAADFSSDLTAGNAPLTVQFTDQSTNAPTAWLWDFGDGGTSTEQNPSYVYNIPGTYTVSLTATNSHGSDVEVKTGYIAVTAPTTPIADFAADPTSGTSPLVVVFTDQSTNFPTSWSWSFGDGGSSTVQNPSYTYMSAGTYTVSLTASNSAGSDTMTRTSYITVTAPTVPQQDWSEFQGGPYHDGVTTNDGTITTAAPSWSVQLSAAPDGMSGIDVAPIVADGKAFVVDYKGYVYAYRVSDGAPLWSNTALGLGTSSFQLSTPAYHNGVLYVALIHAMGQGVDVYALNANDGSVLWSRPQIVTGFYQPNTPVIYDDGHIYFGTWYSDEDEIGRYYCLYANNGTTLWSRSATGGVGYYWAGAAVIGNYLVYGDETGRIVSVNKLNGATMQETTVNTVFGIANSEIHSSVSYSADTHRIYFVTKGGYCCALGFDAGTGHFVTTDKWSRNIGFSTSTPAVYNGKVYVGTGDFSDTNGHTLYCLNEADGSVAWTFVANGGIQASPVVSLNDNGQTYVYFTTNAEHGRAYCVDASGNEKWHFEPESGKVQYTLHGVAIYDGKVLFGNDAAWLFALVKA